VKARIERMKGDEGFTLIELLIVIIILGILAAIVVFAVGNTRNEAVANTCKTDIKSVQLSAEAVKTHEGAYPTTANMADLAAPAKGGLLKTAPPVVTSSYSIAYASDGTTYTITPTAVGSANLGTCVAVTG